MNVRDILIMSKEVIRMELLKSKSIIVLAIMILGVSYLTALDNVSARKAAARSEIISENN